MAWFMNWVRRSPVKCEDDLPINLTEADKGRGWLIDGKWYIWAGDYYEVRATTAVW